MVEKGEELWGHKIKGEMRKKTKKNVNLQFKNNFFFLFFLFCLFVLLVFLKGAICLIIAFNKIGKINQVKNCKGINNAAMCRGEFSIQLCISSKGEGGWMCLLAMNTEANPACTDNLLAFLLWHLEQWPQSLSPALVTPAWDLCQWAQGGWDGASAAPASNHLLSLWHMIAAPGDSSPFSCAFKGAGWNMVEGMLPGPWLLQSLHRGDGRAAPTRGDLEVYKHKLRVYTTNKACPEGCSTLPPCRLPHSHQAFSDNAFLGLQHLSIYWLHGWVYLMCPKCLEL